MSRKKVLGGTSKCGGAGLGGSGKGKKRRRRRQVPFYWADVCRNYFGSVSSRPVILLK